MSFRKLLKQGDHLLSHRISRAWSTLEWNRRVLQNSLGADFPQYPYSEMNHSEDRYKDFLVINWCVANVCNYSCSYCPKDLHSGTTPFPAFETVKIFIDQIIENYKGKRFYFEFTGGEVTLWKDLLPVARYLKENGCDVGIISNGSRSIEFWQKLVKKIDHVCLSFHPESANRDHFIKIVKFCAEQIGTHVNFMMLPEQFEEIKDFARQIKAIPNLSLALQPLMHDFKDDYSYSVEQRSLLAEQNELFFHDKPRPNKHYLSYRGNMKGRLKNGDGEVELSPHTLIAKGQNNWMGWKCHIGLEQLVVTMDGYVSRGWCMVGGFLGNIGDENLKFPNQPISCSKSSCHCNLDIMTTKSDPSFKPDQR